MSYPCLCCGYLTAKEDARGSYEICPVCFWEDDPVQSDAPDNEGGADGVSLNQARKNFAKCGACRAEVVTYVRKPSATEIP